jgi:hypothetical protein
MGQGVKVQHALGVECSQLSASAEQHETRASHGSSSCTRSGQPWDYVLQLVGDTSCSVITLAVVPCWQVLAMNCAPNMYECCVSNLPRNNDPGSKGMNGRMSNCSALLCTKHCVCCTC